MDGGKGEMTMAADARKEVREWPTTSKRRCREGAGQDRTGQDPILPSARACVYSTYYVCLRELMS